MKSYKVVYSKLAIDDLDNVVDYIASIYRKESGLRYKNRIKNNWILWLIVRTHYPKASTKQ